MGTREAIASKLGFEDLYKTKCQDSSFHTILKDINTINECIVSTGGNILTS